MSKLVLWAELSAAPHDHLRDEYGAEGFTTGLTLRLHRRREDGSNALCTAIRFARLLFCRSGCPGSQCRPNDTPSFLSRACEQAVWAWLVDGPHTLELKWRLSQTRLGKASECWLSVPALMSIIRVNTSMLVHRKQA